MEKASGTDILYDLTFKVLLYQQATWDSIDGKVKALSAFTTVIFGSLSAFITGFELALPPYTTVAFWLAFIVFLLCLFFSYMALRFRKFNYLIMGDPVAKIAELNLEGDYLKRALIPRFSRQHEDNERVLRSKARFASWAVTMTFGEMLLIAILLLLAVFQQEKSFQFANL